MLLRSLVIGLVCLSLCACGGQRPSDPKAGLVPEKIQDEGTQLGAQMKTKVSELLANKDYAGLEALAGELRKNQTETACGRWKLDYFYWAFTHDGLKSEPDWAKRMAAVQEWFDKAQDSMTARVALANMKWRYAWFARGGGYAGTVNDDGWKRMHEREAEALKILENAKSLPKDKECPRWWYVRLELAKDAIWDEGAYNTLFNEAISKYPNYKHSYFLKAKCLQPRWHGSEGEWEKFADEASDKVGGEAGDELYAQIVWDVDSTGWYNKGNLMKDFKLDWPRVQKGFAVILKKNPDSRWAQSEYCKLACLVGDRTAARSMFDKINPGYDPHIWRTQDKFVTWRDWAYADVPAAGN